MANHTSRSLIYVIRQTLAKTRRLSSQLGDAPLAEHESILRQLEKNASILSSAVTRLSNSIEHLEADAPADIGPPEPLDRATWLFMDVLIDAYDRGMCETCGGIRPASASTERHELQPDVALRARVVAERHDFD